MTTNKSVGCSNAPQETATDCGYVGLQGYHVDGRTVRKQVHHVESRMEYYWELRSKNAQNIKALMCPLYRYSRLSSASRRFASGLGSRFFVNSIASSMRFSIGCLYLSSIHFQNLFRVNWGPLCSLDSRTIACSNHATILFWCPPCFRSRCSRITAGISRYCLRIDPARSAH